MRVHVIPLAAVAATTNRPQPERLFLEGKNHTRVTVDVIGESQHSDSAFMISLVQVRRRKKNEALRMRMTV